MVWHVGQKFIQRPQTPHLGQQSPRMHHATGSDFVQGVDMVEDSSSSITSTWYYHYHAAAGDVVVDGNSCPAIAHDARLPRLQHGESILLSQQGLIESMLGCLKATPIFNLACSI
jgi:hypothetical protein